MKLVHGSLFSGFDAPSVAASWMGWKNAFHCEINPFCNEILKYWFPILNIMKILPKQTLVNGKEESMSSQADFLASLSPSQVRERERMITVISGHTCSVLYEKSDPLGLLVKTLLESSQWFSPARRLKWEAKPLFSEKITEKEYCYDKSMLSKPSVKTLSEKDIPSNRCLFRLVPSERPTEETGYGLLPTVQTQGLKMCDENGKTRFYPMELLPTPMASDATTGAIIGKNDHFITTGNGTPRKINQNGINGSVGLARMVQLLPTPNAREADKYSKKYNPNSQMGTALTAMAVNGMLPTPIRRDYQPSVSPQALKRKDGKMRTDSLCNLPVMLGEHCLQNGGRTSQLNPLFVEEMMGFPLMWTTLPFLSQNGDRNQLKDMETP